MTEKRFTETISTDIVTDTVTGKEYDCEMRINDNLLNLMNNIVQENEELKKENIKLKEDLEHCANQFINDGKNVLLNLR